MSGPARSSGLRNYGMRRVSSDRIAFLDDDNECLEDHIASLVDCTLAHKLRMVHSYRYLLNADNTP